MCSKAIMRLIGAFGAILVICAASTEDASSGEEGRELRDYNQDWRALDHFASNPDSSGWIPHEEQVPQRRRIRKRKRRPPVISLSEENGDQFVVQRKRPQRLDEIKESWEEMSDEDVSQKTYNRRRLTPIYDATQEIYEKIRDPFTALQEAEEKQKKTVEEVTSAPDLKRLLKQNGGFSLSEVLQQKNLTLSELLSGDKKAISALVAETTTETVTTPENVKYRRLPPSVVLRKEFHRNYERHDDGLTSDEILEAQRKRLSLLNHKNSTKPDVVKEVSTEKTTTTVEMKTRKLPVTSAKMGKTKSGEKPQAMPINVQQDGPLKMTIELEDMTTRKTVTETVPSVVENTTNPPVLNKTKEATAKEEIMEILKNPTEREHLSRILKTRNMTVEELVQLRERGSSQLHLADIFHNKTREPEPKDEPYVGHIQVENFESFPVFHRKPKTMDQATKTEATPFTSTKLPYTITSFPTYKIEAKKEQNVQGVPSIWEQLYPLFTSTTTEKIIYHELETIEEIENTLAEAANSNLDRRYDDEDDDSFITLPTGVKSAILASLAIIALSLLVFLTILVIFKWSQKRKRLNYNKPILENDPKRSFRNFVSETLGKRKNYYKAHLQSMSDSIWDSREKKPYMI